MADPTEDQRKAIFEAGMRFGAFCALIAVAKKMAEAVQQQNNSAQ